MRAISIASFEGSVIAVHRGKDHAAVTIRQVRQVLREFREIGARTTADLTSESIARWKRAHPQRTPVTTRSLLRCLRALCGRARKEGLLRVDPFQVDRIGDWVRSDGPTARPPRKWSLAPEEVRRVLAQADREALEGDWRAARRRAYVWALLTLGMRPGELQRLEVVDFDPDRKTIAIRPKLVPVMGRGERWWRPKTVGSSATIPAGDHLAAVLAEWSPQTGCRWLFPGEKRLGPLTSGGPGVRWVDQLAALGDRAGVFLRQKTGRKTVGTHARGAGLTSLERRALFRHAEESTGDFYDERTVESLRSAVNRLERYYLGEPAA